MVAYELDRLDDKKTDKIYVAGHNGLVGSSIIREKNKVIKILFIDIEIS